MLKKKFFTLSIVCVTVVLMMFASCSTPAPVSSTEPVASASGILTPDEARAFHMSTLVADGHNDTLNRITRQSAANLTAPLELPLWETFTYTGNVPNHFSMVDNGKVLGDLNSDIFYDTLLLFGNPANPSTTSSPSHPTLGRLRHLDIPKMQRGGLNVAFTAMWWTSDASSLANPVRYRSRYLATANTLFWNERRNSSLMAVPKTYNDIMDIYNSGRIAMVLTMEGADMFREHNYMEFLRQFNDLGVLVIGPVYSGFSHFAPSAANGGNGLYTPWAVEAVKEMFRLGILVDLSHMGSSLIDQTITLALQEGFPVIHTHGRPLGGFGQSSGMTDAQLVALARTGGVISIMMHIPSRISASDYRVEHIVQNIHYAVGVMGIDHVGLGTDADGAIRLPTDMQDVSELWKITQGLAELGYNREELAKILGGNMMRVLQTVSKKAVPRNIANEISFTPLLGWDEFGWYVNNVQPTLSARVQGNAASYRVIVNGDAYTDTTFNQATSTLSLAMPERFPNSGQSTGEFLREHFHVVTFEATNASGAVARETIVFRMDPSK